MRYGAEAHQGTEVLVATEEECRAALARFADRLAANADEVSQKINFDRTVACRVTDLGIAFRGRFRGGELEGLAETDDPNAQLVLSATSDDLIALVDGELDVATALASRRVSVQASPFDLLKLRKLL